MDPLSRIFAQTLENVEYLHENGSITAEAYGIIVANLLQVEQAPPPPSQPLPLPQPVASTSQSIPPPLTIPSRTQSAVSEPYIVDSPASAVKKDRGSVNQAVYEYLNEDRVGDVMNQLLKIHPFMTKKDRKALVHAMRKPLVKGVAAATSPDKQAALRKSTTQSLSSAGRSTSNAFKSLKPKPKDKAASAADALVEGDSEYDGADIVTDEDGDRFIKSMSSSLEIAPGLRLDVDTIVRVVLDPEVLLAVDNADDAPIN